MGGVLKLNAVSLANNAKNVIASIAVIYFACVLFLYKLDTAERKRVGVIIILFVSAALFWAGFEQAGSTFNLFAERYTERQVGSYEIPAGWFQSLGPVFVILLAPVMASLWVRLARRNLNPSIPLKFGIGLILLGAGFLVMAGAAKVVVAGHKAWPTWLTITYLVHTFGELCLSPVGLSSVTKLAPRRLVGQMMGTWFLGASLGNLLAGLIAGWYKTDAVESMPGLYLKQVMMPVAAGLLLIILSRPIRRWMVGIK
jgi:POT family proton-dependent oligopeptide transporter